MKVENNIETNNIIQIVKGIGISIIITLILLFVFSLLLTYTNISENTIPAVVIVITGISILIGSSVINLKIKKNGIINGAIVGGSYILTLYVISSILSGSFALTVPAIIMIIVGFVTGMLGGIIGVNLKGK